MNAASEDGAGTFSESSGVLQLIGNEITHTAPQTVGTNYTWTNFSWTSPSASSGTITLYACGNLVNGNRDGDTGNGVGEDGDNPSCDTLNIVVNDPPTITGIAAVPTYVENGAAVTIDSTITISDVDNPNLNQATVDLSTNFNSTQDQLVYSTINGITGSYNSSTGTLTLSGTATLAQYEQALESVQYQNTSDNPTTGARTVVFSVRDTNNNTSPTDGTSINITAVNDEPVISVDNSSAPSFTENANPGPIVDSTITITDAESNSIVGATVSITGNFNSAQDVLDYSTINGITGSYNSGTGVLTLSGTTTLANYEGALETVRYRNTADNPTTGTRTISFVVTDNGSPNQPSAADTATVSITASNDAPAISVDGAAAFTENDNPGPIVDSTITITDAESNSIVGATVSITGNFNSTQDVLDYSTTNGITGSYNSGTGVLTLSGTTTLANYEGALETIRYRNTSDNPTTGMRTISFVVTDNGSPNQPSAADTATVSITAVNDAPVISVDGAAVFTENDNPGPIIDSTITITDAESDSIVGATVSITGNFNSAQDVLDYSTTNGITGSYNSGTGVLTLSGTTTLANYEGALETIRYRNTSDNPTTGTRTVSFVVTDGGTPNQPSAADTATVSITVANDAPQVAGGTVNLSADEDTALSGYSVDGNFSDAEGNDLDYAVTSGSLPAGVSLNGSTGELTGTPTVPAVYGFSVTATETDGSPSNLSSSAQAYSWTIDNVNDAPQIVTNNGLTLLELTTATITNTALAATDEDTAHTSAFLTYTITTAPTEGTLYLNGSPLGVSGTFTQDDIDNNLVTYEETVDDAASDSFIFDLDDPAGAGPTGVTFNITVTLNAPPVVTAGGTLNYTENDGAQVLAGSIDVTDTEGDPIVSATVQITGNYQNGEDVLGFTDQNGITGTFNALAGMLSLSGTATVADYRAALQSVTYANTSEDPSTATRTVSFQVSDANPSNVATRDIAITQLNDAPTSGNNTVNTDEDTPRALVVADFPFTDVDGDSLAGVRITLIPADGSLTLSGSPVSDNDNIGAANLAGNLVFTPDSNESGSPYATLQFRVFDGTALSVATHTMTINVGAENDAPQPVGGTVALAAVDENSAVSGIHVRGGFTDAENNDLDYAVTSGSLPSGVTLAGSTGDLSGTPTVAGAYTFGITATETDGSPGNLVSTEQAFGWTINEAFNDTPQATGGTLNLTAADEDVALSGVSVAGDFSDEDGNDLDYAVTAGDLPAGVTLDTATGALTGTPTVSGNYSFSITATETDGNPGNLSSDPQAYDWAINETVNDAPVEAGGTVDLPTAVEGNALSGVSVAPSFSDEENHTLTYTLASGALPDGVALNANTGALGGTPNVSGVYTFGITATDNGTPNLMSGVQAFSITVTNVNDAPAAAGGTINLPAVIAGDPIAGVDVTAGFSDEDNNTLTYALSGGALPVGVALNATTGALEGTPTSWGGFGFSVIATETDGVPSNLSSVAQAFSLTVDIIDPDGDTVPDFLDNCQADANTDQANNDGDAFGDACDLDDDNDGQPDSFEDDNGLDPFDDTDAAEDADGDGRSNLDEFLESGDPNSDDVPPEFNGVADIVVDATGYLTPVSLGEISAVDFAEGGVSIVIQSVTGTTSLSDVQRGLFRTGRTVITRFARDSGFNSATVDQTVDVRPLANFMPDQTAAEDGSIQARVLLSGEAPQYPVTLDYTVSGTSDGADHDAVSGTLTINSGTEGAINININDDAVTEGNETLVLTLSNPSNAALGSRTAHTITIVEGNVPPVISLLVQQNIFIGPLVVADRGFTVSLLAAVSDANTGDTFTYNWSSTLTQTNAPGGSTFEFDPAGQSGVYTVSLTVTDSGGASINVQIQLNIAATAPALGSSDSDGDGVTDDAEGYVDTDADGVPDHLDAYEQEGEAHLAYNQTGDLPNSKLLQTEPGLGVRLGAAALHNDAAGVLVSAAEVSAYASANGVASAADAMFNVGGIYDFEVYGLSPGGSARVVIPLLARILSGSVYRKFSLQDGWRDFSTGGGNAIASARSVSGLCPAPGHASYRSGLNAFDDCVQLTLVDGGANDADGAADGVIRDPGGVAVEDPSPGPEPGAEPEDGSSGGGMLHPCWLLLMLLWIAAREVGTRRARAAAAMKTGRWFSAGR